MISKSRAFRNTEEKFLDLLPMSVENPELLCNFMGKWMPALSITAEQKPLYDSQHVGIGFSLELYTYQNSNLRWECIDYKYATHKSRREYNAFEF